MNIINLLSRVGSEEATGPDGHRGQERRAPSSDRATESQEPLLSSLENGVTRGMARKGSRGQPSRAGGEDRKCLQLVEGMGRVLGPQDVGPPLSVPPTTCKTSEQTARHSAPWRSQHEPQLQGETGSSAGARAGSPRLGQATLLPEEACQGSPGPLPCLSQPALPCMDFPPMEARPARQESQAGVRTSDSGGASATWQRRLLQPRAPGPLYPLWLLWF